MNKFDNQTIKIAFFGTHDFAAEILQDLIGNPNISVELVITQPDKPVGRKQELQKSAVKILAENNNIKIDQPETLKNFKFQISNFKLCVVCQYGLIIPKSVLELSPLGFINVHPSLLPKYRGASPIQTALMNGEIETGVTIMKMDAGMDTGPILAQKRLNIEPEDIYPNLSEKLVKTANSALLEAMQGYISGKIVPQAQNDKLATYTKIFGREDGKINWNKSAGEIYNQYRGLSPWPGVWTTIEGKRLKLLKIKPTNINIATLSHCYIDTENLYIGCKGGSIEVLELQLEGKRPMTAKEFINGYKNLNGAKIG